MRDIGCDLLDLGQVDPEVVLDQLRSLDLDSPDVTAALDLSIPPLAAPLLAFVDEALPPDRDPAPDVAHGLVVCLLDCTKPGATLDPQLLGADLPWVCLAARLLDTSPVLARQVAVAWVRQLDALSLGHDHPGHPVVVAVAHYTLAATEQALGQHHRARRHQREADAHVEGEPPGVNVAAWARACTLLGHRLR